MKRLLLTISAAILASACQPQGPDGSPAKPPADAPAPQTSPATAPELPEAFRGDLDVLGTEPFWGVQIRETQISYSTPEPSDTATGPNKGGVMQGASAVWDSVLGDKPLRIILTEGECSDGMSDLKYPLTATVTLGDKTLKGCAVKTAEKPREGQ
ncbi:MULTISPECIES: COG3650 family protein [Phenylobacterium]|uniref:Membrane protein n=1 Tax=Phenylobacterium koreense TaxID=266125 RepID=A0ABV2EI71_9CAUL